jgi:hypothetical protein
VTGEYQTAKMVGSRRGRHHREGNIQKAEAEKSQRQSTVGPIARKVPGSCPALKVKESNNQEPKAVPLATFRNHGSQHPSLGAVTLALIAITTS